MICHALDLDVAGSPALAPCCALVLDVAGSPALAPGCLLLRSVATFAVAIAVLAPLALAVAVAVLAPLALALAVAVLAGEFSMPHGQSLHPNGTLTELTMDNTATYSAIPGLDDGRKVFVVVAFEGVFSITSENKVFLRVQPVLLRYVLLDVDGSLPRRLSTPTRDPYCSNPPDDFDD